MFQSHNPQYLTVEAHNIGEIEEIIGIKRSFISEYMKNRYKFTEIRLIKKLLVILLTTNNFMKIEITPEQERLARIAKALGHPTRVAILSFLAKQKECFFGEIHEVLNVSKPTVSNHLSELKEAGLIQGTIEPPKVRYCIDNDNWKLAQSLFHSFFEENSIEKKNSCC